MDERKMGGRFRFWVLLLDLVAACVLFYLIPDIPRPLEVSMGVAAVLGFVTVLATDSPRVCSIALLATSLALTVFALELGEKFFRLTDRLDNRPADVARHDAVKRAGYRRDDGNPYSWDRRSPAGYLEARKRALADGMDPEAFREDFAGDVFKGRADVLVRRKSASDHEMVEESLKPINVADTPLGYELNPDNVFRTWCREKPGGAMLFDGVATITRGGFRETRNDASADDAYVFMGCSFTFGYGLSDWQTLPHAFSEAAGFDEAVVNFGVGGYGPHQILRDLELDRRMSAAGLAKGRVKAVVYSAIDDHVRRVARPEYSNVPVYGLDAEGKLVYRGVKSRDGFFRSRLWRLYERGRVLPNLVPRLRAVNVDDAAGYENTLYFAVVEKMDRICRERYGVGLTVVYWDDSKTILDGLAARGLRVLRVDEAFESGWRGRPALKYLLYDGHPSAYANKLLGRRLAGVLTDAPAGPR